MARSRSSFCCVPFRWFFGALCINMEWIYYINVVANKEVEVAPCYMKLLFVLCSLPILPFFLLWITLDWMWFGFKIQFCSKPTATTLMTAGSTDLTVASWNIQTCHGSDNILDIQRTANGLQKLSSDIVGLQEVRVSRSTHKW